MTTKKAGYWPPQQSSLGTCQWHPTEPATQTVRVGDGSRRMHDAAVCDQCAAQIRQGL